MLKMKADIPGGVVEFEAKDVKEMFETAAFWGSLPKVCPVDSQPTRLNFRTTSTGVVYSEVITTGPIPYRCEIHWRTDGNKPYVLDEWELWDGKTDVLVWKDGKQLRPPGKGANGESPRPPSSPGGQPPAQPTNQEIQAAPALDPDPLSTLRLEINNLGLSLAGNKPAAWDAKRAVHVNRVTKNRTPKIEHMNEKELKELLVYLQKAAAKVPVVGK